MKQSFLVATIVIASVIAYGYFACLVVDSLHNLSSLFENVRFFR